MYENRNKNGLGNENMKHRGISEITINWTIPGNGRSRQKQNVQSQNAGRQYSRGQGSQGPSEQHTQGPDIGSSPYGGRVNNQDYCDGNSYQGYQGGGDRHQNHSNRGRFAKKVVGVAVTAVFLGTVSGGVMTDTDYLGNRLTGAYGTAGISAGIQAQNQIGQTALVNARVSGSQGITAVFAVTDVSGIVENAMPPIVIISDTMIVEQYDFFGMPQIYTAQSGGFGIIVDQTDTELFIVTNSHVMDGASDLKVTFVDDRGVSATMRGTDSASDLTIIAVQLKDVPSDAISETKVTALGSSGGVRVGQQVTTIGDVLRYGRFITVEYVNALDREATDEKGIDKTFIQTGAAINPGSSGGVLIDLNGKVIDINTIRTISTKVERVSFAIPISKAQDILDSLMIEKTRMAVSEDAQSYLEVQGTSIDAATSRMCDMPVGIYIYKIVEDQVTSTSDLKGKDIIARSDGQSVTSTENLRQMLTYYEGRATVTLMVQSLVDGAYVEHDVQMTPGTRPAAQS